MIFREHFIGWSIVLVLLGVVIYLLIEHRKFLKQITKDKQSYADIVDKQEEMRKLSQELAVQLEQEVARRIQSDYATEYLFENSVNAILIVQVEDLKVVKNNAASKEILQKDMLSCNVLELFSDGELRNYVFEQINLLKENKIRRSFRVNLTLSNNKKVPLLFTLHLFSFAEVTMIYFMIVDLSDIVRLEERLEYKRAMLMQKGKTEELGKMIGNISHQWKQPLNSISLICQTLKTYALKNEEDQEKYERYLGMLNTQVHFMAKTIDEFREFFKPNKEKTCFKVYEAIEETLKLFYSKVDREMNVKLHKSKDFEKVQICASKNEFQQIIIVLMENARDAIRAKLAREEIKKGKIEIICEKKEESNLCNIKVRDNGGGVSTDAHDKVFEVYFTTKEHGSGIGLPMVNMILEQMAGKVSFANNKDGAEFSIQIPAISETK
ncbi:sensor histidine kinase [Helicobacter burdigaliensis]|uniref:sensor histidine kinase n=1 Tax=Helicobacter burdigaliensis TaxID=2315334 RepID=UPI000EF644BB|nr:ATP-binding protein [Helicobacter burdigaliensis]